MPSTRSVVAGVLVTAAAGGAALLITPSGGGGGAITCDHTVTTTASLDTLLDNSANTGDTICVTSSLTGGPLTPSASFASQVRVIAQPENQTVDMVSANFGTSGKITFEGFELTGEHSWDMGTSDDIHFVQNYCHDQDTACVDGGGASDIDGMWWIGNRCQSIQFDGVNGDSGYCVYGANWDNLRMEYNTCDQGSDGVGADVGRDCYEMDNAEIYTFIGNKQTNTSCISCGASHPDAFMFWNGSDNGTIKDNVSLNSLEVLISPDGSNTLIQNNLNARFKTNCFDSHPNETAGDNAPLNFTFDHNTAADCNRAFPQPGDLNGGGLLMDGAVGARGGNVWTGNLMPNGSCKPGTFASAPAGNVFTDGTNPCSLSTSTNHTTGVTPDWGTTDWADAGTNATYQLQNPPTGYEDAGYSPAPVGHTDCAAQLPSICG